MKMKGNIALRERKRTLICTRLRYAKPIKTVPYCAFEAKGITTFSNSQMQSKMKRLTDIFFVHGDKRALITEVH